LDPGRAAGAALIVAIAVGSGAAVAAAAAQHATSLGGVALPWIALFVAFAVQWVAFVPAYLRQTEHFYDLTGSVTYLGVVGLVLFAGSGDARSILLAGLISVWAIRLGTFLFKRVRRSGKDGRFDQIKRSAPRFLVAWTLQGLWVFLTSSAALAAMSSSSSELGMLDIVGATVWLFGFSVEVVADRQKSAFKESRPGQFIDTGLWAWSRHPNYFGEIVIWIGVGIIAAGVLQDWQWVTMVSPMFVIFLLTRVSGLPQLEERGDERWGGTAAYEAYKAQTPVLVPRRPRATT
jgi:steroid 5-alpha reductase family enzyme